MKLDRLEADRTAAILAVSQEGLGEDARRAERTGDAHIMVGALGQTPETSRLCVLWAFI